MSTAQSLDDKARTILQQNDKGGYTVPTHGLYPYQWNWDSAFAAMGFAQFDIDRAWVELETLFSGQWDDGMVPHILFHQIDDGYFPGPDVWQGRGPIPSSGISQPPVAATLARRVFDRDPEFGAARLAPLFDKLLAWHRWFMDWRLDCGAVCITHPWEAGRDNAPDWDIGMAAIDPVGVGTYTRRDISHVDSDMRPTKFDYDRYIWLVQRGARLNWQQADLLQDSPFRVADPTMTFTLLRANRDLLVLADVLGRDTSKIQDWISVLEAGAETLWNPTHGHFDGRDVLTGEWANSLSNASFLCWYAGIDSAEMREHLRHVLAEVSYGIPSLDLRDERFDGQRYWRGPVWGMMNMMAGLGMNEMGMPEGEALRQSTAKLIAKHGFAEYFDPRDGTPAGGQSFTWTAAVWLGWASPTAEAV
ncbi:MAG: hypothetical protein AAGA11_09705 [Pseudomonadota bacterium]